MYSPTFAGDRALKISLSRSVKLAIGLRNSYSFKNAAGLVHSPFSAWNFLLLSTRICPSSASAIAYRSSGRGVGPSKRSEEHTSELQSLAYLVCRLLLEKKKKKLKQMSDLKH